MRFWKKINAINRLGRPVVFSAFLFVWITLPLLPDLPDPIFPPPAILPTATPTPLPQEVPPETITPSVPPETTPTPPVDIVPTPNLTDNPEPSIIPSPTATPDAGGSAEVEPTPTDTPTPTPSPTPVLPVLGEETGPLADIINPPLVLLSRVIPEQLYLDSGLTPQVNILLLSLAVIFVFMGLVLLV